MKMIVGLGNPGPEYARTRHNVGFMVVDRLARRHGAGATPRGRFNAVCVEASVAGERTLLLKPTTFMNRSGQSVQEAAAFYKIDPARDLLVLVDDIYLPLGSLRLRPAGGAGGHNGLSDIQRALGSEAYPRLRIGVGQRDTGGKPAHMDQADYVLGRFTDDEARDLEPALDRAADASELFLTKGVEAAMNRFNAADPATKPKPPKPKPPTPPAPAPTPQVQPTQSASSAPAPRPPSADGPT